MGRRLLRYSVLFYLAALLIVPVGMITYRTFEHGLSPVWDALTTQQARHAALLSVEIAAISVPINVIFGVGTAWLIARRKMPLRHVVSAIIDLPFAMSPVSIGLALFILYGRTATVGSWFIDHGVRILFALPGMVLATTFVCIPFVVREVLPVLEEQGSDQEQAAAVLGARPWQSFIRITLPSIRLAIIYGVVLSSARALGEFGAVSIVSGDVVGQTQTLPLFVEERFRNFDATAAYSGGFLLAVISLLVLVGMSLLTGRRRKIEGNIEEGEVAA
jgi:sulfate transport system permease protein